MAGRALTQDLYSWEILRIGWNTRMLICYFYGGKMKTGTDWCRRMKLRWRGLDSPFSSLSFIR
jgi:hypothetical protein